MPSDIESDSSNPFELHSPLCDDLLRELLKSKRSPNTRQAYEKDLKDFFWVTVNRELSPQVIGQFLSLERVTALAWVVRYKNQLIERGLAEATVNRRLCALRSLVNLARKLGYCEWSLQDIAGEKVVPYRDTRGMEEAEVKRLLEFPDRETFKGKRDYAIFRLLWSNALRRAEVSALNVEDINLEKLEVCILGKGRGTQREVLEIGVKTKEALQDWFSVRNAQTPVDPLFISIKPAHWGQRLSGDGIYYLVRSTCKAIGVSRPMSPHRIRHSAVTCGLEKTNGNTRAVQAFSRHAQADTMNFYDDHRPLQQAKVTQILDEL